MHEQNRSDSTCSRKTKANNGVKVGRYDPNSIMNYCRSHSAAKLTKGDIAGIHHLYKITRPASGSIIDTDIDQPIEEEDNIKPAPRPSHKLITMVSGKTGRMAP